MHDYPTELEIFSVLVLSELELPDFNPHQQAF